MIELSSFNDPVSIHCEGSGARCSERNSNSRSISIPADAPTNWQTILVPYADKGAEKDETTTPWVSGMIFEYKN